jgi:hypothetical protein
MPNSNFNPEAVKFLINETANQVTKKMVEALIEGLKEKLDFKQLAEKHINLQLEKDLSSSGTEIQLIFPKLLISTFNQAKASKDLETTFAKINDVVPNGTPLFISSFVLPAIKPLLAKIEAEQPGVLNNQAFWL